MMKKLLSLLLALAMLLAAQAVFAEGNDPVEGIFSALTAEGSGYSKNKETMKEYYPGIRYEEKLEGDRLTMTVTGGEDRDGSWTFVKEGDFLTVTAKEEDFAAYGAVMSVLGAVGDYYGMNSTLLTAYLAGLNALGLENPYLRTEADEAAGTVRYSIYIAGAYDMKELDRMVLTEEVLNLYDYEPLTEEYTSRAANLGKVSMVCNGSRDGLVILLMEYGEPDDIAYQDLVNLVKALQPAGWAAFAADYTELKDAEGAEYKVAVNVDRAAAEEIVDDPPEGYSFIVARFGTEAAGGEPADAAEGETAGESERTPDTQYVLFLGTNDKDTNKPVFTQAEAMERAKDILIRHFGGYTIQEASGGWIDEGKIYQEYTLIIYLSDTTIDEVHKAADEMVDVFRQSSVLIEAYQTRSEFYSGK